MDQDSDWYYFKVNVLTICYCMYVWLLIWTKTAKRDFSFVETWWKLLEMRMSTIVDNSMKSGNEVIDWWILFVQVHPIPT